ncbi:MAG: phosphoglucosamine mutase [Acidobacteriota bacterium]
MTAPRLFGTDGVRGQFGTPPMDETTLRRLGAALGRKLALDPEGAAGPKRVVLGGDTRASTPQICRWLAAELAARGFEPVFLGTVPTPAVASTTAGGDAVCGIAVSASHNPYPDNGVKLIDADGFKWSPAEEAALEALMDDVEPAGGEAVLEVDRTAVEAYLSALTASLGGRRLDGLAIGLDTGNGAASPFARHLFESLGARVTVLGDTPDGENINRDCGSTAPARLAERVRSGGLDLGIAFDGDADRAIVVDEEGSERDGDAILFLWATDLHHHRLLPGDGIVATSMSNLGLEVALRDRGVALHRCDVGDREVVRMLRDKGLALGGEQSGHIVHLGLATTGDGLLTALHVAALVHAGKAQGQPLSRMLAGFTRFPQLLHNLKVPSKPPLTDLPRVQEAARRVERELGDRGRLVLRYSGTESLVRIMIEGPDKDTIEGLAHDLARVLEEDIR